MAQRIVLNKHYNDSALITRDKFLSEGEIVISNEAGFEGIYILNSRGEVVKIGGGSFSGSSVSDDVKQFLKENYMTSAQTIEYVSAIATYLQDEIENLTGTTVSDEHISELAALEVAKIVASADTNFDTLKEIADWISSDETNSVKMANDIQDVSAATASLREYIDEQLRNVTRESDHVFLSKAEYNTLLQYGVAVISGETYFYKDDVYYCIYDSGSNTPDEQGGIIYELSGDSISFPEIVSDQDGFITIDAPLVDGFIDLDAASAPSPKKDMDVDGQGNIIIYDNVLDDNGFLDITNYNLEIIQN